MRIYQFRLPTVRSQFAGCLRDLPRHAMHGNKIIQNHNSEQL